ncbi:MAG: hypothetical protein EOP45_11925 [Sphingobacteriaceae bacterium]|nr:MAG: hypothetical protein EOP45_11925 [Sphingobacteriaceae bacterium]
MSNLYSLFPDGQGYRFKNAVGDEYYAYFTPFTLQTEDNIPYETMSFGFECKRVNPDKKQIYDERTKQTIAHIIKDYFDQNGDDALLYICLTNDGKARHRNIIFGKWFKELGNEYERHRSKIETQDLDFFSSILVKSNNPKKKKIVNAFHYTIDFWFPYEED